MGAKLQSEGRAGCWKKEEARLDGEYLLLLAYPSLSVSSSHCCGHLP